MELVISWSNGKEDVRYVSSLKELDDVVGSHMREGKVDLESTARGIRLHTSQKRSWLKRFRRRFRA